MREHIKDIAQIATAIIDDSDVIFHERILDIPENLRSKHFLGAGNLIYYAWINPSGLVERTSHAFEDRFCQVMRVPTVDYGDVEIEERVEGKGPEKLLDEGEVELVADVGDALRSIEPEEGPTAHVERDADKCFIHGKMPRAISVNTPFFSKGGAKGLSKHDADILHRVVIINLDVALGRDFQVTTTVFSEKRQHVIEERNPGFETNFPLTIEIKRETDLGFGGLSIEGVTTGGDDHE